MRIAVIVVAATLVGLAGWAWNSSDLASGEAIDGLVVEDGGVVPPRSPARPDVLAAPPRGVRRVDGADELGSAPTSEAPALPMAVVDSVPDGTVPSGSTPWTGDDGEPIRPCPRLGATVAPVSSDDSSLADEKAFSGGRDQTLDVVRLDEPQALLRRFRLLVPASGTSTTIPLGTAMAIVRRSRGASSTTLDVPEDRGVVAFVGQVAAYVADYDVEISQSVESTVPIYDSIEAGLGVWARLSPPIDGGVEIALNVRWRPTLPSLPTCRWSLTSAPRGPWIVLEVPKANEPTAEFRGRVRFDDGEGALVGLSNGGALVVIPRGGVRETTRVRTEKPVDSSERTTPDSVRPPASETIDVAWTRLDADSERSRGSVRFEHVGEAGVVESPAPVPTWPYAPVALAAPGSASIVPGPIADCRLIDVVVRPTSPLDPGSRTYSVVYLDASKPYESRAYESKTVDLPRASRVVIPLRFLLRDGETGERDVTIDRGDGPETWCVTASRRVERAP